METDADREARLKEDGTTSAMNKIITTAFHMVHLINFFTAGPDEVRAWTIRKGYKAAAEPTIGPWMLGRFTKSLKVGLVGMPNVGKSTLYNSLSKSHHSKTANVPFCTIDPTETRAFLEDERFDWLVEQHKPASEVKAYVTVVDIAGLISGASQGEGLGNAFLSHIQAVDGIIHVMRAFEDDDVIHAEDTVDPVRDIITICNELRIKDLSFMQGKYEQHKKGQTAARAKSPNHLKQWEQEKETMEKIIALLEEGKELGSEANVKAAGKYRQEGKMYEVQDGDVIFYKFGK